MALISLKDIGKLSEPATALIEKVSGALEGAARPWQIKRVARAEAEAEVEAALIRARGRTELSELERRTFNRFWAEQVSQQENIEAVTKKAIPSLEPEAKSEAIEDDWVVNFFDKARLVSNEEMQQIWARLLAGEANRPGSFSRRTVNLVASLDRREALYFQTLMRFAWNLNPDDFSPLIYNPSAPIYREAGLDFNIYTHLDRIGLITFLTHDQYAQKGVNERGTAFYKGVPIDLEVQRVPREFPVGHVKLSLAGQELASIAVAPPVPGFLDYVLAGWQKAGIVTSSPLPIKRTSA